MSAGAFGDGCLITLIVLFLASIGGAIFFAISGMYLWAGIAAIPLLFLLLATMANLIRLLVSRLRGSEDG